MKLKGSNYFEINLCVTKAKEMKRGNYPVPIYLNVKGENVKKVKSDLKEKYKAEIVEYWKFIDTLNVKIPARNIRRAVEESYVKGYEFPGEVEVLSENKSKMPSLGFTTGHRAPDHIEITNETTRTKQKDIIDLTRSEKSESRGLGRGLSSCDL
jgi:hypothetical protein